MYQNNSYVKHAEGGRCPSCQSSDSIKTKGFLVLRKSRFGVFLGCSRFPRCQFVVQSKYIKPSLRQKSARLEQQANKLLKKKQDKRQRQKAKRRAKRFKPNQEIQQQYKHFFSI